MTNDTFAYPPRGMSRVAAARYLGIGTTKFDELVRAGKVPKGCQITEGRIVWDRVALDLWFDGLPANGHEPGNFETYLRSRTFKKPA